MEPKLDHNPPHLKVGNIGKIKLEQTDLLPCPFCGGNVKATMSYGADYYGIACANENCYAEMGMWFADKQDAIRAWNKRDKQHNKANSRGHQK